MSFKGASIKGMDGVRKNFQKFLKESQSDPTILKDVGDTAVDFIKGSVRARREDYKVDNVGPGWAAYRSKLAAINDTAPTYVGHKTQDVLQRSIGTNGTDQIVKGSQTTNRKNAIKKSATARANLTFTGQLLDSMTYKILSSAKQVRIFFQGTHKPYKTLTGKGKPEAKSNASIAKKLNDNPKFHFLFVSKKLEVVLKNRIIAGIRRKLSNYRKLKRLSGR